MSVDMDLSCDEQVLKKIELVDDSQKDTKMFRVTADFQYKEEWAMSNVE